MARKSTITVADLSDGETKQYTFEGDAMNLREAVEAAGFSLDDVNTVERNEAVIPEDNWDTETVRNGDSIFLIPLVEGGRK